MRAYHISITSSVIHHKTHQIRQQDSLSTAKWKQKSQRRTQINNETDTKSEIDDDDSTVAIFFFDENHSHQCWWWVVYVAKFNRLTHSWDSALSVSEEKSERMLISYECELEYDGMLETRANDISLSALCNRIV